MIHQKARKDTSTKLCHKKVSSVCQQRLAFLKTSTNLSVSVLHNLSSATDQNPNCGSMLCGLEMVIMESVKRTLAFRKETCRQSVHMKSSLTENTVWRTGYYNLTKDWVEMGIFSYSEIHSTLGTIEICAGLWLLKSPAKLPSSMRKGISQKAEKRLKVTGLACTSKCNSTELSSWHTLSS